jgi:hypothetical protein
MNTNSKVMVAVVTGVALGAGAVQGLHAQAKPKAYTVTELQTLNPKLAADVAVRIAKAQEAAGGHNFKTGGGTVTAMEGSPPQRVAITE